MAMKRPGYVGSPSANEAVLRGDQKFMKFKQGESKMLRFLPAPKEDNILFYPVSNHYGLKNQEGRDVAVACLGKHGSESTGTRCLVCDVVKYFMDQDAKDPIADKMKANTRLYSQVLEAEIADKKVKGWSRPRLMAWSPTAAQGIQTIFSNQEKFGQPFAYDHDQGQALIITREGEGFQTKYPAERTGEIVPLDTIRPTWADEFITDMYDAIGLNAVPVATQEAYLRLAYPKLDWDGIFQEIGYEPEDES